MSTGAAAAFVTDGAARPRAGRIVAVLVFAGLASAPLAAPFGAEGYVLSILTRLMIFALAALSLDLILGYGGLISFGHAAFLGIGAYSVGILTSHGVGDVLVHLATALAVSALVALVVGALSLRTQGVYFIMITLAFGQMLFFLATSLAAYGGDDGMTLPSRSLVFGRDLLGSDRVFYYVVFACLLLAYLLCRAVVGSRFGRVLRGSRENPVRMQALGFNPLAFQLTAFVVAGMLCGVAGFLLANHTEFVSPAYHDLAAFGRPHLHDGSRRARLGHRRRRRRGRLPAPRGVPVRGDRALAHDLRPVADPGRRLRARRHHGLRQRAPSWLSRCCVSSACASVTGRSSSRTT